jgi:flagellar basal-body rod protein FlgG
MIKGIYTAARALDNKIKNIDVIANNLANLNSTGFKREIPFCEILNEAGDVQMKKITSQVQGEIAQTSNPLDLAISGNGFFVLRNENGTSELTRDGRFKISEDGFLINDEGKMVLGQNGPISLEDTLLDQESSIKINKDGEINIGNKAIGTILVVNVADSSRLSRVEGSNFISEDQQYLPETAENYAISQGYLEQANTNPIVEMQAMIQLNKEYESAQKIINVLDLSLGHANEIGKV